MKSQGSPQPHETGGRRVDFNPCANMQLPSTCEHTYGRALVSIPMYEQNVDFSCMNRSSLSGGPKKKPQSSQVKSRCESWVHTASTFSNPITSRYPAAQRCRGKARQVSHNCVTKHDLAQPHTTTLIKANQIGEKEISCLHTRSSLSFHLSSIHPSILLSLSLSLSLSLHSPQTEGSKEREGMNKQAVAVVDLLMDHAQPRTTHDHTHDHT